MQVESAHRPHAIGYKVVRRSDGAVFHLVSKPRNVDEAKDMARWFIQHGYKFDAGIAQVNSVNFERYGITPENMFDACTSIRTGARILQECYARASSKFKDEQTALGAAVSCYQSGNFNTGYSTGYVSLVRAAAGAPIGKRFNAPELVRGSGGGGRQPGTAGIRYIPVDPRTVSRGDDEKIEAQE